MYIIQNSHYYITKDVQWFLPQIGYTSGNHLHVRKLIFRQNNNVEQARSQVKVLYYISLHIIWIYKLVGSGPHLASALNVQYLLMSSKYNPDGQRFKYGYPSTHWKSEYILICKATATFNLMRIHSASNLQVLFFYTNRLTGCMVACSSFSR